MNRKQRDRHEYKMYRKGLRYGARYEIITTPAIRELNINKKKRRGRQILRYYLRYYKHCKDNVYGRLRLGMERWE